MNQKIKVSVIIPCRNEEQFIGKCLDSLLEQDFPKENLEILVVDGISEDKTREIVEQYSLKYSFIKLFNNPKNFTSFALNIGIKNSVGDIIVRIDAHAEYPRDYISKCVEYLIKFNVDNVGGNLITKSKSSSITAKSIALVLSHFFGAGGSSFRTGFKKLKLVDTVFCGCYKRDIFKKIGYFNENLKRSQDLEFNLRLKKSGGKILLVPDIVSYYYPKSSLKDFFTHTFVDGIWAVYPLKFIRIPFRIRHYIPFLFVFSLVLSVLLSIFFPIFLSIFFFVVGLYALLNFYFSLRISIKEKNIKYLFIVPIVFAIRHIAYGLGSIFGLFKIILNV